MFKKLLLLIILLGFIPQINIFADSIPVENVFSDIDSNYKYLDELQTLYDKWMVSPDSEWKFNPYKLLTREEFVWITMEASCEKCIKPSVDYSFIEKYKTKPFYDVWLDNKYFYCISDALANNYVNWYDVSYTCDDGTYSEWEKPFCTNNNIILEEALAILLKISWILTNNEAQDIINKIYNWIITEKLSDDISPKNIDGTVYSFYPYFLKALDYEVIEYDEYWNKHTYYLVEVIDGNLRPKKNITKEEFLRIAFVSLKANSCLEKQDNSFWLNIDIFDFSLNNENTYDFGIQTNDTYENVKQNLKVYIWKFYNEDTGEEDIKYWEYIDNYTFKDLWKRTISLKVIDNYWNISEINNSIVISGTQSLLVSIDATPISWIVPLRVDLDWIVVWNNWSYSYKWNFWNWDSWFWKIQEIVYKNKWLYEVVLNVTDKNWNKADANIFIKVDNFKEELDDNNDDINEIINNVLSDSDWDWVNDIDDNCPLIKWEKLNRGCPIVNSCSNHNDCLNWYICNKVNEFIWFCELSTWKNEFTSNNDELNSLCNYSGWSAIIWNTICETCPCDNFLDYISTLRKCDSIFPAITSPDNSIIYSKWNFYKIK